MDDGSLATRLDAVEAGGPRDRIQAVNDGYMVVKWWLMMVEGWLHGGNMLVKAVVNDG